MLSSAGNICIRCCAYTEWLELHRPRLMRQGDHPYALIDKAGNPMSSSGPTNLFLRITGKFLAEGAPSGTGVVGVRAFCIHRMRQIVSSHLVREDKDYIRPAFALADSKAMVKFTYSWLTDADCARFVSRASSGRAHAPRGCMGSGKAYFSTR